MSEHLEKQTSKQAVKPPSMTNVIFVNDDFTTFEFVTSVLMTVFQKSESQAELIAGEIHQKGKGLVGQYTPDIAQTKQNLAMRYAETYEHPLMVLLESA